MLTRTSFRFSPNGRFAVCLAGEAVGRPKVERWVLGPAVEVEMLPLEPTGIHAQPLVRDDGRVVLCQPVDGAHEITGGRQVHRLAVRGLRVVEHPDPAYLATAFSVAADGTSTVWLVTDSALRRVVTLPGLLAGGSWLDHNRLGVNQAVGGVVRAIGIDLTTGSADLLWPDRPSLRLLLAISPDRAIASRRISPASGPARPSSQGPDRPVSGPSA